MGNIESILERLDALEKDVAILKGKKKSNAPSDGKKEQKHKPKAGGK